MIEQITKDLVFDEGLRLFPYRCTAGKLTIGVGRNLDDKGLSREEMQSLIYHSKDRSKRFEGKAITLPLLVKDFGKFGITEEEAFYLLQNDIYECIEKLEKELIWFKDAPEDVKRVLVNMCFNLGIRGLLKFKNTLRHIQEGNYEQAAKNMLMSLWAKQVKGRAVRLSNIIKNIK